MSGELSSENRNQEQHISQDKGPAGLEGEFGRSARAVAQEAWLTELGYSADQISEIKQVAPDLNIQVLRPAEDARVEALVTQACAFAFLHQTVTVFRLHDIVMAVSKDDRVEETVARYMSKVPPGPVADFIRNQEEERERQIQVTREQLPQYFKDWLDAHGSAVYGEELTTRIAQDAFLVATVLETREALLKWADLQPHEQDRIVPGLFDAHSGYSFGMVTRLSAGYLKLTAPQ